jgi:hypothetical protein
MADFFPHWIYSEVEEAKHPPLVKAHVQLTFKNAVVCGSQGLVTPGDADGIEHRREVIVSLFVLPSFLLLLGFR